MLVVGTPSVTRVGEFIGQSESRVELHWLMHLCSGKSMRDMEPQQKKTCSKKIIEGMTLGMPMSLILETQSISMTLTSTLVVVPIVDTTTMATKMHVVMTM